MLPPHRPFRDKPASQVVIKKKYKVNAKPKTEKDPVPQLKPDLVVLGNSDSSEAARS